MCIPPGNLCLKCFLGYFEGGDNFPLYVRPRSCVHIGSRHQRTIKNLIRVRCNQYKMAATNAAKIDRIQNWPILIAMCAGYVRCSDNAI